MAAAPRAWAWTRSFVPRTRRGGTAPRPAGPTGMAFVEGEKIRLAFAHEDAHGIHAGVGDNAMGADAFGGLQDVPSSFDAGGDDVAVGYVLAKGHGQVGNGIAAGHGAFHGAGIKDVEAGGDVEADDLVTLLHEVALDG